MLLYERKKFLMCVRLESTTIIFRLKRRTLHTDQFSLLDRFLFIKKIRYVYSICDGGFFHM